MKFTMISRFHHHTHRRINNISWQNRNIFNLSGYAEGKDMYCLINIRDKHEPYKNPLTRLLKTN